MAVTMVARGKYYHSPHRREYLNGQRFHVDSEAEADRIERRKKAMRAEVQPASQADFPPTGATAEQGQQPRTDDDDLPALRAEYEGAAGKRPFMGWGAGELRRRIAELKGSNVPPASTTDPAWTLLVPSQDIG